MNTPNRYSNRKPLGLACFAGGAAALWHFRTSLVVLLSTLRDQQAVSAYVQQFGAVGPAILFGLLVAQVCLAVLPGQALMLASGYLYGFSLGTLVAASGTILGGELSFWLARRGGRKLVNRLASPALIERWDRLAAQQGGMFFFFTFILPIFPSDLMSYIAGMGKVSPRTFFVVNFFGRLPCAICLSLIGAYGFHLPLLFWLVIFTGLTVLFIAWLVYSRRSQVVVDPGARCYAILRWLLKCYLGLFRLRYTVKGTSIMPAGSKILAANHPNATDAFFLPCILHERLYVLVQGSLFNLPIIGRLLDRAGQIPVWPGSRSLAFEKACQLLRQGHTVVIFPEGKLNPDQSPLQAGTGAVRMSLATGAPIIPVGLHVADKDTVCLRHCSKTNLHAGRWQVRGCCSFQFGEAWNPSCEVINDEGLPPARQLTEILMGKIYTLAYAASEGEEIEKRGLAKGIARRMAVWDG